MTIHADKPWFGDVEPPDDDGRPDTPWSDDDARAGGNPDKPWLGDVERADDETDKPWLDGVEHRDGERTDGERLDTPWLDGVERTDGERLDTPWLDGVELTELTVPSAQSSRAGRSPAAAVGATGSHVRGSTRR